MSRLQNESTFGINFHEGNMNYVDAIRVSVCLRGRALAYLHKLESV